MKPTLALSLLLAFLFQGTGRAAEKAMKIERACTTSEKWIGFEKKVHPESLRVLDLVAKNKISPERVFSEGYALRRRAQSDLEMAVGDYMMARALFSRGLLTISEHAFRVFLANPESTFEDQAIERASIQCITQIHRVDPSFRLGESLDPKLRWFNQAKAMSEGDAVEWIFSFEDPQPTLVRQILDGMAVSSDGKKLALGILSARKKEHSKVIEYLAPLVKLPAWPSEFKAYRTQVLLLLGRAYYTTGDYGKAVESYRLISKSSNELAQSLVELSWAYLKKGNYPESVGTALHLRLGGLSRTFAPESEMLIAMSENEICQFPDSIRAIEFFKLKYAPSYDWLSANATKPLHSYYSEILKFVKTKKSTVPPRVIGEWIRGPSFLTTQDGINRVIKETAKGTNGDALARNEEISWQRTLIQELKDFRRDYNKNGRKTNPILLAKFKELRREIQSFRRFIDAAPIYGALLQKSKPFLVQRKAELISRIEKRVRIENERMLTQLNEVAVNNEKVEIEIYSGASEDMLWKEAHPDYDSVMKNAQIDNTGFSPSKFWDWGRIPSSKLETSEIWEDELGSSRADLKDNCSNQEKYLELKMSSYRSGEKK